MSAFDELRGLSPIRLRDGVAAWAVEGTQLTLSVVELDPGAAIPEHAHENEQLGLCLSGSMRFRVGDEEREIRAGSTWSIPPHVPHDVTVGEDGCVVVEAFAPARDDWAALPREEPRAPRAPAVP